MKKIVCVEYWDITYHDDEKKSNSEELQPLTMKVYGELYDNGDIDGVIKILSEETVDQDGGNNAFYTIPEGCVFNITEYKVDHGYTIQEHNLQKILTKKAFKAFNEYMKGQTCEVDADRNSLFYEWDFFRWVNGFPPRL